MQNTVAGARLRRLREERRMTQAALARLLGISASYLNQIEHGSRPLTVPVLLSISEFLGVDAGFFATHDTARLTAEIREVASDDTLRLDIPAEEAAELAQRLPHTGHALVTMHRRYRQLADQLAALTGDREHEWGELEPGPHEEIRDYFYQRHNYIGELDEAAERLAAVIGIRPGDIRPVLAQRLGVHGIRVRVGDPGSGQSVDELHRYDPRTQLLHLSGYLRPGQLAIRMATQLAFAEAGESLTDLVEAASLSSPESETLARIGLAKYFAAALILPYRDFHANAEEFRYDLDRLATHYGVGYETVCHRVSTLQRPRARGVAFSFVRVDRAGNMSKRQSATGFHFSRTGGTCPLWNVYEAFAAPGRILTQIAVMPDGRRYFWIARTVTRTPGRYGRPGKSFAIGLGCDLRQAGRLVYSTGLDLDDADAAVPIGIGCKVCERSGCPQRAFPQIGRGLSIDENHSTFTPYPVADPER